MPRRRGPTEAQPGLFEARVTTAPCVPAIREAVAKWRDDGYKGSTATTRQLLNQWFLTGVDIYIMAVLNHWLKVHVKAA